MDKNKYQYIAAGVIVLAVVAYIIYGNSKKAEQKSPNGQNQNSSAVASPTPSPSASPASGIKKLSYGEAIKAYRFRFQFSNCSANPGSMSVKINTPVMLDNRDNKAHTIKVSGQSFRVSGYDYQLLYPKSEGTFNMTCDGGGSGTLNVEK